MKESEPASKFAAIVLAAGMSRRMGSPKALLEIAGRPSIARLVDSLTRVCKYDRIIVVTGHEPQRIHDALTSWPIRFVFNPNFDAGGMLSSIKTGVQALPGDCSAFFLALLDQPLVRSSTLKTLTDAWNENPQPVMAPTYQGRRGHPILIDDKCRDAITSLSASETLRDFVTAHQGDNSLVDVDDPAVVTTLDTLADFQELSKLFQQMSGLPGAL